jgi:aerobic carbon-monoxide dehydrogenase large subunit
MHVSNDVTSREGQAQAHHGADPRLVTGLGSFSDDRNWPGQAHVAFLRAPIGAGRVNGIDLSGVVDAPGVIAAFSAADLTAAGWGDFGQPTPPPGMAAADFVVPRRPVLVRDQVRHIGELLAMVVAETRDEAEDALELIVADVEGADAVVDIIAAQEPEAPQLWDMLPRNIAFTWREGNETATRAALENASHVVHVRLVNQRLVGNPLEPRAAIAAYDAENDSYTLVTGSQGVSGMREQLLPVLKVPAPKLRVISPDVGGGFGIKTSAYPEYAALLFAAKAVGRPVKWLGTRADMFMSDNQARDSVTEGWLGLDDDGRFVALRVDMAAALGGYIAGSGSVVATRNFASGLAGPYRLPQIAMQSRGVMTNTLPVGPYRGAGRPEASYLTERLVDEAARLLGMDPAEIRARNLLRPDELPHKTALGAYYDSGDFPEMLRKALTLSDWDGFAARREAAAVHGLLRGIGIASFLEIASSALTDTVDMRFTEDGFVEIRSSVQSTGQDHATTFRMLAARTLQVPMAAIRFITADSADTPAGPPTVGSRGATVGGGAVQAGCLAAIARGNAIVAQYLEVASTDIVLQDGAFLVAGTDLKVAVLEVAKLAHDHGIEQTMNGVEKFTASHPTFPNGCHVAEVEIDPETGTFQLVSYTAVDDAGTVLNHPMVEGQVMGGIAQGFGQVAAEHCIYDESGQIITGSFMDYGMPRADDLPSFQLDFLETPSPATPLGVKGCGEAGTTGALPAIMNAINNALAHTGASPVDAPVRPETLFRALRSGGR